jgi:hypothetical protein
MSFAGNSTSYPSFFPPSTILERADDSGCSWGLSLIHRAIVHTRHTAACHVEDL